MSAIFTSARDAVIHYVSTALEALVCWFGTWTPPVASEFAVMVVWERNDWEHFVSDCVQFCIESRKCIIELLECCHKEGFICGSVYPSAFTCSRPQF